MLVILCCGINAIQMAKLINLEWNFGVTASSDELQAAGESFLLVKYTLQEGGKSELKHIAMEMSLSQFYHFLHEMEKAKAAIDAY